MAEILKIFDVIPVPKPRMTRKDRWTMHPQRRYKARPCVKNYLEYKEELQWQADDFELSESGMDITFVMPMPRSWSKKKKAELDGYPHQQTPDLDNLLKALFDALCPDGDAHISDCRASKVWGFKGRIRISHHQDNNVVTPFRG